MKTKRRNHYKNKTCKIVNIPGNDKDIKAMIDSKAIEHNIRYLEYKSKTEIMPILKANAYGHGIIETAKILRKLKTRFIGVATLGEAIFLRKSGDKGRILSWLYDIEHKEMIDGIRMDLDIAIFDETHIQKIEKMIPKGQKRKITAFIDTGINRAGIPYEKAFQACKDIAASDKFEFVGLMSHLVCSEIINSPIVNEQLRKFRELRKNLKDNGISPPLVHIANTSACLHYDVSDFTLSRSGSGIYGLDEKINKNLKLATTIQSYIIQIKSVQKGDGIGYNWKYIAPKNMKIAILPIGYADIIPMSASLHLFVYVNGSKRRVLGTISMDQIVLKAKDEDKVNDIVTIFGNGKNCPQTIYDIAKMSKCPPYEILCHMGYRIHKTYT